MDHLKNMTPLATAVVGAEEKRNTTAFVHVDLYIFTSFTVSLRFVDLSGLSKYIHELWNGLFYFPNAVQLSDTSTSTTIKTISSSPPRQITGTHMQKVHVISISCNECLRVRAECLLGDIFILFLSLCLVLSEAIVCQGSGPRQTQEWSLKSFYHQKLITTACKTT